jgi:hypothetical protein
MKTSPSGSIAKILLALSCALLLSGGADAAAQSPAISLTSIPVMGTNDDLSGTVTNVTPANYRVAVYIFVQGWWNKPTDGAPLTVIQNNGAWTCDITTGGADPYATKIAAFVVPQSYAPPLTDGALTLPADLNTHAVASVITDRPSPNAFHWCGYDWDVKNSGTFQFGPGPNYFSDSTQNVWVDGSGKLHLRITHRNGQWQCAEVFARRAFGYGTYRCFVESVVDALDPNVVLGLFTYDDDPTATNGHREIDVEISRWGNGSDPTNAQFVVQPFNISGNLTRWTIPTGATPTTHSFAWSAGRIDYVAHNGAFAPPPASVPQISSWSNTGGSVPSPGDERMHLNLWLFNGTAPSNGQEVEVVLSRFAFIPAQTAAPGVKSATLGNGGVFHLLLNGDPQVWYQLESTSNLLHWSPLSTMIAAESAFEFVDSAGAATEKFYRVSVVAGQ